jgi:addiction module HigA family antidote
MSDAELRAIIAADDSKNKVLSAVLQLALETAMRRSELVNTLEWRHVDLDARVAHLPDTKGGVPRNVPLSATAIALLRGLPEPHKGHVFEVRTRTTARGQQHRTSGIKPDGVTLAFARVRKLARAAYEKKCKETGEEPNPEFLMNLRFHDARHEATSSLFEKGFNPMEAAAVTGHKDLKTLMRYTHLNASKLAHRLDGHGPSDAAADHPHPGEKLRDYLPNASKIALIAKQIGVPKRELMEVVAGRARVDADLAVRLEVLGPHAELWAEMQLAHDLQEVRRRRETAGSARKPGKSAAGASQVATR